MKALRLRESNQGFTLLELVTSILVSGLVMAGSYTIFGSQQGAFTVQERIAEMNQNIREVMDLMTREVRLAGYKTSTSTFNGIATAQPSTIRILADLDQNGDTLGADEDITYSYNAGTLQICRNGTSSPVADNVTNLGFVYTLKDGSTTSNPTDPADVRAVTISITTRTAQPDATGQYRSIALNSIVTFRNLAS